MCSDEDREVVLGMSVVGREFLDVCCFIFNLCSEVFFSYLVCMAGKACRPRLSSE